MKKMIAALVAATFGLSTAAIAQTTPPAPPAPGTNGTVVAGTTISTTTALGIGFGALFLGAALSGDDESGTTTTTTTTK